MRCGLVMVVLSTTSIVEDLGLTITNGGVAKVVGWLRNNVAWGNGTTVISTDPTAPGIVKQYLRYSSSLIMEYANRLGGRFQLRWPGRFFQNQEEVIRDMTIAQLQSYAGHRGGKKTHEEKDEQGRSKRNMEQVASEGYEESEDGTKKSRFMQKMVQAAHKKKNKYGKSKTALKANKASNKAKRKKSKRTYKDYYLICIRDGCDGKGKRHQRKSIPTTGKANKSSCKFASCNGSGAPTSLSSSNTVSKYWSYALDEHGHRVEAPSDEETDEETDEEKENENDENDENDKTGFI